MKTFLELLKTQVNALMSPATFFFILTVVPGVVPEFSAGAAEEKPRVIVLTDISNEPDDEQSMVRFLMYSNEFDVEGLIATTSVWLRDKIRPERIRDRIRAYGEVRDNLLEHASGYPTVKHLLSVTKPGRAEFGMEGVGSGKNSEGSDHIINVVDTSDKRPVWICVWGGPNCLAQALWDVKNTRKSAEVDAFVEKLRVYTISDQDNSGHWLRKTFPNLFYIVTPGTVDDKDYPIATWVGISGDRFHGNFTGPNFEIVDNPWLTENIRTGHGPLGALYPLTKYLMEGDTPSFLNLIPNGLAAHIDPEYGGWGGRYALNRPDGETRPIYTNVSDTVLAYDGNTYTTNHATVWRWREAYQNDFAARMDWCVDASGKEANHNPIITVNGSAGKDIINLTVESNRGVKLNAVETADPDGDSLTYNWFHYPEPGTYKGPLEIKDSATRRVSFVAPKVKSPETIHIICSVNDDGNPKLYSYRRIIITVTP